MSVGRKPQLKAQLTRNVKLTSSLRRFSFYLRAALVENVTYAEVYLHDLLRNRHKITENRGSWGKALCFHHRPGSAFPTAGPRTLRRAARSPRGGKGRPRTAPTPSRRKSVQEWFRVTPKARGAMNSQDSGPDSPRPAGHTATRTEAPFPLPSLHQFP